MFDGKRDVTYDDEWLEKIMKAQEKIGEGQIWKGFITQQWGDYQEKKYRDMHEDRQYTGTTWAKFLITEIYRHMLDTWGKHNKKLHRKNQTENPHREKLQAEIENLYRQYEHTPEILKCLYKHRLHKLLQKSTAYLKKWKEIMDGMESSSKVQVKRRAGQDIQKYLPMLEKPPEHP